jgi:hypothetical protein
MLQAIRFLLLDDGQERLLMKCEVEQNTHNHDYLFNVTTGEALLDVSSELPDMFLIVSLRASGKANNFTGSWMVLALLPINGPHSVGLDVQKRKIKT